MTEMKAAVLAYVRNINTQPGPNAGRSIDSTKPGPTADRIADPRPPNCRFRLQDEGKPYPRSACTGCGATITTGLGTYCIRLRNEQPKGGDAAAYAEPNYPPQADVARQNATSPGPQDVREKVTLNACPPGLFMFNGTLGFRSEYMTESAGGGWQVDAYVVESGQYFWGGAPNPKERGKLLVEPIPALRARAADRSAPRSDEGEA